MLILFSLCIICAKNKQESEFAGASGPSVHSLFAAGTRHKRQVRNPREETCSTDEYTRRYFAIFCDPSNDGYGQPLVDIYAECILDETRKLVHECSRDENGRFCYELRHNASNYTNSVTTNCPSTYSVTESTYQCTDPCRDALENLKSNIGCCLNDLYNTTSPSSNFLNTRLWSACGIIRPDFCSGSTLTQGSLSSSNCKSDYSKWLERLYQFHCNVDIFYPYLDLFQQCEYHEYYELSSV